MIPFFNRYPYTDFNKVNLDWIINKLKSMSTEGVEEAAADAQAAAAAAAISAQDALDAAADAHAEVSTVAQQASDALALATTADSTATSANNTATAANNTATAANNTANTANSTANAAAAAAAAAAASQLWTLAGSNTGTGAVAIPPAAKEIIVRVTYQTLSFVWYILQPMLGDTFDAGAYAEIPAGTPYYRAWCRIVTSSSAAACTFCNINNVDRISDCTTRVYYR